MSLLRTTITSDLIQIESDLGNPTFTWNSGSYPFIPSVSDFTRELDTGGYKYEKMLTATIRKYNADGSSVFSGSIYPSPQQKIIYTDGNDGGLAYRIETIKHSPEGAYMHLIAASSTKGF